MAIEPIAALSLLNESGANVGVRAAMPGSVEGKGVLDGVFDAMVTQMQSLNTTLNAAAPQLSALAVGQTEGLETVMLNMERTRLQFDALVSVRNRVLEAYQELMRMQV